MTQVRSGACGRDPRIHNDNGNNNNIIVLGFDDDHYYKLSALKSSVDYVRVIATLRVHPNIIDTRARTTNYRGNDDRRNIVITVTRHNIT